MSQPKVSESTFSPFHSLQSYAKHQEARATEADEPRLVVALGHLILLGLAVVPLPVVGQQPTP